MKYLGIKYVTINMETSHPEIELVAIEVLPYSLLAWSGSFGDEDVSLLYWMRRVLPSGVIMNEINLKYYREVICYYTPSEHVWDSGRCRAECTSLQILLDCIPESHKLITDPKEINKILMTQELLK